MSLSQFGEDSPRVQADLPLDGCNLSLGAMGNKRPTRRSHGCAKGLHKCNSGHQSDSSLKETRGRGLWSNCLCATISPKLANWTGSMPVVRTGAALVDSWHARHPCS